MFLQQPQQQSNKLNSNKAIPKGNIKDRRNNRYKSFSGITILSTTLQWYFPLSCLLSSGSSAKFLTKAVVLNCPLFSIAWHWVVGCMPGWPNMSDKMEVPTKKNMHFLSIIKNLPSLVIGWMNTWNSFHIFSVETAPSYMQKMCMLSTEPDELL